MGSAQRPKIVSNNGMTPRSPQREALAEAIKQRDQVATSTEQTRQALQRARSLHEESADTVYDLRGSLKTARDKDARLLEQAVRAGTELPPSTFHQIQSQLAEAEHKLAAATKAMANLEASVRSYQTSLDQQDLKVGAVAKRVMSSEMNPQHLVDEVRQLKDTFESKIAALGYLVRYKILEDYDPKAPGNDPFLHHDAMRRQASPSAELLKQIGYGEWRTEWMKDTTLLDKLDSVQVWRKCLEALQKDADASLPTT
jgi:hypothetical protein